MKGDLYLLFKLLIFKDPLRISLNGNIESSVDKPLGSSRR